MGHSILRHHPCFLRSLIIYHMNNMSNSDSIILVLPLFHPVRLSSLELEQEEEPEEGEWEGADEFDETEAVKQELRAMSNDELVSFLEDRGADTSGDKEDLVERLAALFAPELDR